MNNLEHETNSGLRCGIVNTFVDPYDKKEQKKAQQRMWKNAFRLQYPERNAFYNRNKKVVDQEWVNNNKEKVYRIRREWYARNKKEQRAKAREKYVENHEAELKRFKEYREKNGEKIRKSAVDYYYKNRETLLRKAKTEDEQRKRRVYMKRWRAKNLDKIRQYQNTPNMKRYNQERQKTEHYKEGRRRTNKTEARRAHRREYMKKRRQSRVVETRVRAHVSHALKAYANGKIYGSKAYGIDYYAIALKLGKKPGLNYDADKIIPASLFDLHDPQQVKICFSPENYQWLEHIENIRKGGKNRPETVAKYMPMLKAKLEGV